MAGQSSETRQAQSQERPRGNAEAPAAPLATMDLAELRGALELTQEQLAQRLEISQSNVSRLENRNDMLVSTLRQVVEALGGGLRLVVVLPEGRVRLKQFDD